MYTMYVDGELFFSTALQDEEYILLSPKLNLDINSAGSLTFVIPPGNRMYNGIQKIKSIITVYQDDDIIFRGRVLDDEKDFYNQKNVYCEGEKTFLLDSLFKPYSYSGGIHAFFKQLITSHNKQVEKEKRFTVGEITAVSASATMEAEDENYNDTSSVIEDRLLGANGGYISTRTEGDVHYIDWLTTEGNSGTQEIEFGVNLLDLKEKVDASNVFTVLIPLGASEIDDDGNYTDPVTIESVNDGKNYIQDDEAVNLYGKIWRTQTWPYEDDPAKLKKKGQEFMKTGVVAQTLTLNTVDMHFTDRSKKKIWIGDHPHIFSNPHGLDLYPICARMAIDLLNQEKTTYTFGEPPRTLTENTVQAEKEVSVLTGGGRGGVHKELGEVKRWAEVKIDAENARINTLAWDYDELAGKYTDIRIDVDAVKGEISTTIKEQINEIDGRVINAESSIRQNADNIETKVSTDGVISSINQSAESVVINAKKIDLSGYVTAAEFSSLESDIAKLTSGTVQASHLHTQNLTATNTVRLAGHTCEWMEATVISGGTCSFESTQKTVVDSAGNAIGYVYVPTKVTFTPTGKKTIDYLGT